MILIVDDDFSVTTAIGLLLKQADYPSLTATDQDRAMQILAAEDISLVIQDMNFSRGTSGEEGLELLQRIKALHPDLPVLLITAWGSISLAVEGMKAGAADFITKPWSDRHLLDSVRTALGLATTDNAEVDRSTREELERRLDLTGVVGNAPAFLQVLRIVGRVAATEAPVLITGDSGTGKEVIAETLHRNSARRKGPFVCVNLGGISSQLFDSEMFGHVRGAYTDAHRDREGRFATADGGTIFLDEIGELDPVCQVKLLRVLQERTYEVLGSSRGRQMNARVVSATNRDLSQAVEEGCFREDLLYRLNLIVIRMPTLQERIDDLSDLADHFLAEAGQVYDRPGVTLGESGLKLLRGLDWPGNIRQLRHLLVRSLLITDSNPLEAGDFQKVGQLDSSNPSGESLPPVGRMTLAEIEKKMIVKCLTYHDGNISLVAESLGLSRPALYRRLEKYGITP
jgi:two-component system, NtrC family, response regulator